ncbi:hypothetical protein B7463_g6340, partial [Scytalidium lignicola]
MEDVEKAYKAEGISLKRDADEVGDLQSSNASEEKDSLGEEEVVQTTPTGTPVDEPPDGEYGWVCVASVFFINLSTWGLNSSYGVFLAHYLSNNTFPGATALDYAFVGGLSIAVALAVSPISTLCTRAFGTHVTLFTGIIFETGALLGASWAKTIAHLFVTQGMLFGIGMGFLFVGSVGIVPQWFTKRRSFANSLGTAGSGLGGLMYSLATNAMIQSIGLAWAFRVLAILAFAVNGIATILVRDRNKQVGAIHLPFDVRLFKRPEYLLVLGWGFFSMLGYVVLLFSLGNYATSIGLSAKQGSTIVALLNLGQGLGRPLVGLCSDAAGRINLAGFCTFLAGLFCLVVWIFAKSYGVCIFFAILVGSVAGVFWSTVAPVVTEVVGLQVLPSALSILWVVLAVPCTFAEPIGLELRATTGDKYLHCQIFTGCMYLGATVCLWFLRVWKMNDLEKQAMERRRLEETTRQERIASSEGPHMSRTRSQTASTAADTRGARSWHCHSSRRNCSSSSPSDGNRYGKASSYQVIGAGHLVGIYGHGKKLFWTKERDPVTVAIALLGAEVVVLVLVLALPLPPPPPNPVNPGDVETPPELAVGAGVAIVPVHVAPTLQQAMWFALSIVHTDPAVQQEPAALDVNVEQEL